MSDINKLYRPRERHCAWCGGLVICHRVDDWRYKCRDYRKGKNGGTVVFCSWP